MHGKCLSFSVHEKRAKAQWEREDNAANLINMNGLLHACVHTCGCLCALLCVFLNTCVWLFMVIEGRARNCRVKSGKKKKNNK